MGSRVSRQACRRKCAPWQKASANPFQTAAKRLMDLGLGYLTLDRAASTLSTGERQRMQLARAVRNRTTGVLYVLDEPSIGLHPSNIVGLTGVMRDLIADGNSVILVDHDTQILCAKRTGSLKWGRRPAQNGGHVIAQGTIADIAQNPASQIGPFLSEKAEICRAPHAPRLRRAVRQRDAFICPPAPIHTVKPLDVDIPKGRLTVVTGVSGSGKTTLILESLVPGAGSRHRTAGRCRTMSALCRRGRHRAGQADRRHAHRHQRPLYRRHLRQRPRRTAQDLRPNRRMPKQHGYKAGRFFLQYRQAALSGLRRNRRSSVWMCSFCRMWIFPVRTAAVPVTPKTPAISDLPRNQTGRSLLPARTDGYGCQHGP